jgi:hypothetical protein
MVGKKAHLLVPVGSARLQYDFLVGDMLPPHGHGEVADLEIEWKRPPQNAMTSNQSAFRVHFIGEGNGIVVQRTSWDSYAPRSRLRSLYEAPARGYVPDFAEAYSTSTIGYIRIRTGSQPGPMFGKMLEGIAYRPRRDTGDHPGSDNFEFIYVVNPSGSRNLEIDMEKIEVPNKGKFEDPPPEY